MNRIGLIVTPLRALLGVAFVLLVIFQTLSFPGQFAHMARQEPDMAYLRWPLTIAAGLGILCIQIVVASTWKLLSMVKNNRIFSQAAFRWVDAIVGAIGVAWLMLLGVFLYVGLNADDPGLPMVLFLLVVGGAVLGLLMIVMRALLSQATTLRTDMEQVI